MNKAELIEKMAIRAGITKAAAGVSLEAALGTISDSVTAGEPVAISGFGTFEIGNRAARTGRNPLTGEPVQIAAKRAVKFKPSKALKESVN